jgi:hypothetical protein
MNIFAIESIGFSGTTSLSNILGQLDNSIVSHGTRNFYKRGGLGPQDLDPNTFTSQMCAAAQHNKFVASVHTLFDPLDFQKACVTRGISYMALVRNPADQIYSCYSWAYKKVIRGDQSIVIQATALESTLRRAKCKITLSNLLYFYACQHVIKFNIRLLKTGCKILHMEKLLSDKSYFLSIFNLPSDLEVMHFNRQSSNKNGHKSFLTEINAVDPDLEFFNQHAVINHLNYSLSVNSLAAALGYE